MEKRQFPLLICLKWKKTNYISILKWMNVFLCDWHLINLLVLQWPTTWSQISPEKRRADTPSWVRRSHGVSPYHTDLGGPTCTCHQGGAALYGPQDWSASSSISLFPWTKNVMTSIWRNFENIVWFIIQGVVNCTQHCWQSTLQGVFQFQLPESKSMIKDPEMETHLIPD